MRETKMISARLEDYMAAIFLIVSEKQVARAKDIAFRLKVSRPSVTGALRSLSDRGLINYAPYEMITLTSKGRKLAKDVVRRHEILKSFFVEVLGVDEVEADEAACKMEHAISHTIMERLKKFMESIPRGGEEQSISSVQKL